MKVKASDLTKSQLRYFRKEEEWYQEAILEALSRKPFKKVFKGSGWTLTGNYIYRGGNLGFESSLISPSGKTVWHNSWTYEEEETYLDGDEPLSCFVKHSFDMIYLDICSEDEFAAFICKIMRS